MLEVKKRKMKKWLNISFILLFFGLASSHAQVALSYQHPEQTLELKNYSFDSFLNYPSFPFLGSSQFYQKPLGVQTNLKTISPQPIIYNYHHLALFCKIEVKLEKATKFPVKVRLGDVEYVDQLEGK